MKLAMCALLLLGCGDAVVDGRWPGEPLYRMQGWVALELGGGAQIDGGRAQGELRVGVFWAPTKGGDFELASAVEQEVSAAGSFPARFSLTLYAPPPAALLRKVADGSGELAQALVLAYLDQDGDGRWDREAEPLVGGAPQRLLLYTPHGIDSATFGSLAPGFHRVVPTGLCASASGPRFVPDGASDFDLIVSMAFPVDTLLDIDCDGSKDEWSGVCPPPESIRVRCVEVVSDVTLCGACAAYAWSPGSDAASCDDWFDKCLYSFAPTDCESEWHVCRGDAAPSDPGGCTDLQCTCKRYYTDCRDSGYEDDICVPKYDSCVGT